MANFILRRSLYALLLLLIASLLIFYGLRARRATSSPPSPRPRRRGHREQPQREARARQAACRPVLRLPRPRPDRRPRVSVVSGAPITTIIKEAGPKTLALGISRRSSRTRSRSRWACWRRPGATACSTRARASWWCSAMGIPNFFLAVLLIQLFAVELGWLPPAGPGGLNHLVLPAVVLAMEAIALNMRLMRSSVLEELLHGLHPHPAGQGPVGRRILWVHAFRNALTPVIALAGSSCPCSATRSSSRPIFRYEGLGYQLVQGIIKRDYALAQTLALLLTATVIFFNFLADIAHQLIDPRVRDRARVLADGGGPRRPRRRRGRPRAPGGALPRRPRPAAGQQAGLLGGLLTLFVPLRRARRRGGPAHADPAPPLPRPEPLRRLQAPGVIAPARHRPVRARHHVAHDRRHGHLGPDRVGVTSVSSSIGLAMGRIAGYFGGKLDTVITGADRPHLGLPAAARRRDLRGHAGAGPGRRDPRRRSIVWAGFARVVRAQVKTPARARVRRGGARARHADLEDPAPAPVPERAGHGAGDGVVLHRHHRHRGGGLLVHRPGRPAADAEPRADDLRRPQLLDRVSIWPAIVPGHR